MKQRYVPAIDGLRAAAVLAVLAFHCATGTFSGGFLGVDLFFVISGHVITSSLLDNPSGTSGHRLRAFYRKRFWRLAPALLAMVVQAAVIAAAFGVVSAGTYAREAGHTVTSTYNLWLGFGGHGEYLDHTWSLGLEEQFYLLWAPLFLFVVIRSRWSTQVSTALGILVASTLARAVTAAVAGTHAAFFLPWNRLDELMMGVVLALMVHRRRDDVARLAGPRVAWAAAAGLGVLCLAIPTLFSRPLYYGGFTLIGVLSLALVAHAETRESALTRLLAAKPSVWLGKRSYGFYLYHFPLIELTRNHWGYRPVAIVAVVLPVTLVLCDLSYRFLERPLRLAYGSAVAAVTT